MYLPNIKEILAGIERKEFELFFQSIVDLKTGEVVGREGLARWLHPDRGLLTPDLFVPTLDREGKTYRLCYEVIRLANAAESTDSSLWTSINISPITLCRRDWRDHHPKISSSIYIEVVESLYIDALIETAICEMRNRGFKFSADDFGHGYLNFVHLSKRLFDIVKLDISVIRNICNDLESARRCAGLIKLIHDLGMKVVAEGVESSAQARLLISMGCDMGQGFLWDTPKASPKILPQLS
ncbi:MAG: EAL domain-containing protein [Cyanobacteria bacterium P01_A01_bin.17]